MTDPVSRDPAILGGKPCITGTRIAVSHILENLAGGVSIADYAREHLSVTEEDVCEALLWAAREIDGANR